MSTVSVVKTSPNTVVRDIGRLMHLADFHKFLPIENETILKINISWHYHYPGCSTSPWQFEGVVKTLLDTGYSHLTPAQNRTVVVDPKIGARKNHLLSVLEKYNLNFLYLYEHPVKWITYEPKGEMLVLDKVFASKGGIKIPEVLIGRNALHLPTLKTHVFTTITGAMKNAFGGLLNENRHWTHNVIHETLVDLLRIQKEIHPGLFCVTDGTIAGSGAGPRAFKPHVKNYLLASGDMVAIDAIAAKMMGFDPLKIPFIRIAHEHGLGTGDPNEIEVVGEDISDINFKFDSGDTFASRGQHMIYHGILHPFEKILLRSPFVPWSFFASKLYHDLFWYPLIGLRRKKKILTNSGWGDLFQKYGT
jgi:uncharacterized protein (DUF362 family)